MKRVLMQSLVGSLVTLSLQAMAATESTQPFELSCRIKAKEVAAETYRGCVTENRKAQIDQVRADYQAKLKSLKDEYDQELKRLSGAASSKSSDKTTELNDNSQAPTNPNTTQVNPSSRKSTKASPSRVASTRSALPNKRRPLRGSAPAASTTANDDMSVQLRPSTGGGLPGFNDDSTMDIPEPIPVETIQSSDSQI